MILGQNTKRPGRRLLSDYCREQTFLIKPLECIANFGLDRLGLGVLQDYTKLRSDTQAKNIAAWTPVVGEILHGFCRFDDKAVSTTDPLHGV